MAAFLNKLTGKDDKKTEQKAEQAVAVVKAVVHNPKWGTRMGDCDPPATCEQWMLSCFCTQCAAAKGKTEFDGSNMCVNILCWNPVGSQSWMRRGYGIDGTCGDDLMCGLFCAPCNTRRALTESSIRGKVPLMNGGPTEWQETLFGCGCCEFFQAIMCPFCISHSTRLVLQPTMRPDCCFDVLCMIPFGMYSQVRHTYGIQAEFGCAEDIFLPLFCFPCAITQAEREAKWRLRNRPQDAAASGIVQNIGKVMGMR
jgi:hypothetical protein